MILFIASTQDIAGINIAKQLILNYNFNKRSQTFQENPVYSKTLHNKKMKLLFVNTEIVETQFLNELFNPELFIFLSRHSSLKAIPTLSVHTPGNLAEAKFGGKPRAVSISPAYSMKNSLLEMVKLKKEQNLEYEISYECTHHGPSLDSPTMFIELGSSLNQWNDIKAAKVVADAAVAAISTPISSSVVLGIGGPHYNRKFTNMALNDQYAFGHIIPKYNISKLDSEMLKQCINRTVEPVESVILDWKGIKGDCKPKIISALDYLDITSKKV